LTPILIIFIFEFLALAVCALWQKNYGMVLYGLGGGILNIGVLVMGIK